MSTSAIATQVSRMSVAWNRFWFTPADPTVLGAIRVLTGVIAFYTLLTYTFDLQELMGENAWLDLQLRQDQYRDAPVPKLPLDWNYARPPATEWEKTYATEYFKRWGQLPPPPYPTDPQEAYELDVYRARWGMDRRQVLTTGRPIWSIWFHVTDPFWMNVVHAGILVSCFLFMLGCGTRVTSVLTWLGALSYIHRNPAALFGADTMMAVLLLYLMIGPSGAALSVDRLIARWWAKRKAAGSNVGAGSPDPAPSMAAPVMPSVSANLTVRLIQVHCCIIYLAAGLAKLQGLTWWTGIAPWGTLANYEYAPMEVPLYVEFLRFLARTRWLYEATMTIGALGTLTFEIGYVFLIWRPGFRTLWLWLAVLLHLGIGMFMGLRTFSLLMLAFNLAFVSPLTIRWAIDWALRRFAPRAWQMDEEPAAAPPPEQPPRPVVPTAIMRPDSKPAKPVTATQVKRKR